MIIYLIFLIPGNILCSPSLVKHTKIADKPTQISVFPSIEPDVKISKIKINGMNIDDNRTRRSTADSFIEPQTQWNYLRQYICRESNLCMKDERFRFDKLRPDILKKISKMATYYYDWSEKGFPNLKEPFSDTKLWNNMNLSVRPEGPLYVEEPNFVVVNKAKPFTYFWELFYRDDPFIPQRGRKNDDTVKVGNNNIGMPTNTEIINDVVPSHFRNSKENFEENKQSFVSPTFDFCCHQGMYNNYGISKLCFVRCYGHGIKIDSRYNENVVTPREVDII